MATFVGPTAPPPLEVPPAGPPPVEGAPAHSVDGAHVAPLEESKQQLLSQSLALVQGVAQVSEMHGPEQHQSREQLPPGPAHVATDVSMSAGTSPAKQVSVDVQTAAPSKQQRLTQSMLESHGPAQTSELQIALPQQGMSQAPPGGEHCDAARGLTIAALPLVFAAEPCPASARAFPVDPPAPSRGFGAAPPAAGSAAAFDCAARAPCGLVVLLARLPSFDTLKHRPDTHVNDALHRRSGKQAHPSSPRTHAEALSEVAQP